MLFKCVACTWPYFHLNDENGPLRLISVENWSDERAIGYRLQSNHIAHIIENKVWLKRLFTIFFRHIDPKIMMCMTYLLQLDTRFLLKLVDSIFTVHHNCDFRDLKDTL